MTRDQAILEKITVAVAERTGVSVSAIRSRTIKRSVAESRHAAMYLATRLTPLSKEAIGRYFGERRHSAIIWGEKRAEALRDAYPAYQQLLEDVERNVRGQ